MSAKLSHSALSRELGGLNAMTSTRIEYAPDYSHLSKDLLAICKLYGRTSEQISGICQVSLDTVNDWETGSKRIPVLCAYELSKNLGIAMPNLARHH